MSIVYYKIYFSMKLLCNCWKTEKERFIDIMLYLLHNKLFYSLFKIESHQFLQIKKTFKNTCRSVQNLCRIQLCWTVYFKDFKLVFLFDLVNKVTPQYWCPFGPALLWHIIFVTALCASVVSPYGSPFKKDICHRGHRDCYQLIMVIDCLLWF